VGHVAGHVLLADFGVTAMLEREMPFMSDLAPVAEAQAEPGLYVENGSPDSSQPGSENSLHTDGLLTSKSTAASYLSRKTYCGTLQFMAPEIVGLDEEGCAPSLDHAFLGEHRGLPGNVKDIGK
jgi:serine/threonine protein kinase